jgi:predicted O-linked N-acetylglucosamine transferase (SPINDLY family)
MPECAADKALGELKAGAALMAESRFAEAAEHFRRAIALAPQVPESHNNLAAALQRLGDPSGAIPSYQEAIRLAPGVPELHHNLAMALQEVRRFDEAIAACRRAIALRPAYADAYYNLAKALRAQGEVDAAIAANEQSVALRSDNPHALSNLANLLADVGRVDEAIALQRRAASLPDGFWAASNVLQLMHYHPGYDAARILQEHRQWNMALMRAVTPARSHENDRAPDRRLRVGYVSPDFRNHVVGANVMPLFRHHDRGAFEIFCYANLKSPADAFTEEFRALSHGWRDISRVDDRQAVELIRQDRIDILVDLTVHTAHNRMPVFARKPAPIQVSFAGYPATSGLETIDYRLTDPYLDPPENEAFSTERLVRLPDSFWCYQPDSDEPQVNALPAVGRGFVTFGCLSSFFKINDQVVHLWARVLAAVKDSRLLVLAPRGSARQRLLASCVREGIEAARVEFADRQPRPGYLRTYHRIDITLDTFPYNAHTTGLDSLWMGVPVVTLAGRTSVSRAGWSQLNNLRLTELAAHDPDEFVRIAIALAADLPRLAQIRRSLRQRMRQSPLMDAPRFARSIETAYRQMWHTWCDSTDRK